VPAAAAIVSAIEDALRDYRIRIEEIPVVPARLFELIHKSFLAMN
jgi:aerobic carbon-monoxide dehydrogenase large subunit